MSELEDLIDERESVQSDITQIDDEFGHAKARLITAIEKDRWFRIKGKPGILFDKQTAYLWNSHSGLSYDNQGEFYSIQEGRGIAKDLVLDGMSKWFLPDFKTFDHIVINFPFRSKLGKNILLTEGGLMIEYFIHTEALLGMPKEQLNDSYQGEGTEKGALLVYNNQCSSEEYVAKVAPNHHVYTKRAQQQATMDLLAQHHLEPILETEELNEQYYQLCIRRPTLLHQIESLDFRIKRLEIEEAELRAAQRPFYLLAPYNYKEILKSYALEDMAHSPLQYAKGVVACSDYFLGLISGYEESAKVSLLEYRDMGLKLSKEYEPSTDLTADENKLLEERLGFLAGLFTLNVEILRGQIDQIRAQGVTILQRIERINNEGCSFSDFSALHKEERVYFPFIVENIAELTQRTMEKLYFFGRNTRFFHATISAWENFEIDYKMFKSTDLIETRKQGTEKGVDNEVVERWISDWTSYRFQVEQMFYPLVDYALGDHLLEGRPASTAETVFFQLFKYKGDIDRFYIKKAFEVYENGNKHIEPEVRTRIEMIAHLFETTTLFQKELANILMKVDSGEERKFLIRWATPVLEAPEREMLTFLHSIPDYEDNFMVTAFLKELEQLKQQDLGRMFKSNMVYLAYQAEREEKFRTLIKRVTKERES